MKGIEVQVFYRHGTPNHRADIRDCIDRVPGANTLFIKTQGLKHKGLIVKVDPALPVPWIVASPTEAATVIRIGVEKNLSTIIENT